MRGHYIVRFRYKQCTTDPNGNPAVVGRYS